MVETEFKLISQETTTTGVVVVGGLPITGLMEEETVDLAGAVEGQIMMGVEVLEEVQR